MRPLAPVAGAAHALEGLFADLVDAIWRLRSLAWLGAELAPELGGVLEVLACTQSSYALATAVRLQRHGVAAPASARAIAARSRLEPLPADPRDEREALAVARVIHAQIAGALARARVESEAAGDDETRATLEQWLGVHRSSRRQFVSFIGNSTARPMRPKDTT